MDGARNQSVIVPMGRIKLADGDDETESEDATCVSTPPSPAVPAVSKGTASAEVPAAVSQSELGPGRPTEPEPEADALLPVRNDEHETRRESALELGVLVGAARDADVHLSVYVRTSRCVRRRARGQMGWRGASSNLAAVARQSRGRGPCAVRSAARRRGERPPRRWS